MLSVTTDYAAGTGDPAPYLKRIGEAGFSHVHWCHQWNTDFLYSECEIDQMEKWFKEYGIALLDIHGSHGNEKSWYSAKEYERLAGVELVQNRIHMAARLNSDVVIMHIPKVLDELDPLRRSLDELRPFASERGVLLAIENTGNFPAVNKILSEYDPGYVGLCYDAGHGNIYDDIGDMDAVRDRLLAVHLHDNDGEGDQHKELFSGTLDWEGLAKVMAKSAYTKPVSMEISIRNSGYEDEVEFLALVFETGTKFAGMIEDAK
jgi:sugar phosphate isomerase/epimerase